MILINLKVKKANGDIVRNISFNKKGISLIVDEENKLESGNNIGKTTLVKIIDICLGNSPSSTLYKSPDTGENKEIKEFIIQNKVIAHLTVEVNGENFKFSKGLYPRASMYLNDDKMQNQTEFNSKIKEILFGYKGKKPSLNQLRRKFIRLDRVSEEAVRKFLFRGTNIEYQAIYEILFNLGSAKGKNLEKSAEIEKITKKITSFLELHNVYDLDDLILKKELIDDEVLNLQKEVRNCSTVEAFTEKEQENQRLDIEITSLKKSLDEMNFEKNLYNENLEYEISQISNIDTRVIEKIYLRTKLNVQRELITLEKVKKFHNSMTMNRTLILNHKIEALDDSIEELKLDILTKRNLLEKTYVNFNMNLNEKFQDLTIELNELKGKSNEVDRALEKISNLEEQIEKNKQELVIEDNILGFDQIISDFNDILSSYTKKVLNQTIKINYKKDEGAFPITLIGIDGNLGTGESKALIACYDLALIRYYFVNKMNRPNFIIHDKMENIDLSYLKQIYEIMNDFEGQYIIPILRDRISELDISKDKIICELSRSNKFFRV